MEIPVHITSAEPAIWLLSAQSMPNNGGTHSAHGCIHTSLDKARSVRRHDAWPPATMSPDRSAALLFDTSNGILDGQQMHLMSKSTHRSASTSSPTHASLAL